jgi:hypothetical protein
VAGTWPWTLPRIGAAKNADRRIRQWSQDDGEPGARRRVFPGSGSGLGLLLPCRGCRGLSSCQENHRGLDLHEKVVIGEAGYANPRRARRLVAKSRLQHPGDRFAFVHVAMLDIEAQRTDLVERGPY